MTRFLYSLQHPPAGPRRQVRNLCLAMAVVPALLSTPAAWANSTARLLGPAGKCLGISGEAVGGAAVVLETCNGAAEQLWQLPTQGFLGPIVSDTGFCLDITGASTADDTALQLFTCHGGDNQTWRYDGSGLVGGSGKCLSIRNGGTLDGTPAVLSTCQGGDNQRLLAETQDAWSRITGDAGWRGHSAIWVTADPAIFYHRQADGVIERSEDAGRTWTVLSALPAGSRFQLNDSRNPNVFFFLDGQGEYLLRSNDGGRSYQAVLVANGRRLSLAQDPTRPSRFWAAVGTEIWRSDDGTSFGLVGPAPFVSGTQNRVVLGADGALYFESNTYCTLFGTCTPGEGLSRSRDGGATWQTVSLPFPVGNATFYPHPTQGRVLYLHDQSPSEQLWRSEDEGNTWVALSVVGGPTDFTHGFHTTVAAPDSLWTVELGQLWRSDDRGTTWNASELPIPGLHESDVVQVTYGPGLRIRVYANVAEGIYRLETLDGGETWIGAVEPDQVPPPFSALLPTAQAGRYFGLWGAELWRTDNGARTWQKVHTFAEGGNYGQIVADPLRADHLYLRTAEDRLMRSFDAGKTFTELPGPGANAQGNFRAAVLAGQTVLLDLTSLSAQLWRSLDAGATWSPVTLPQAASDLVVDGGVVYAWSQPALQPSQLLRSLDAGITWETLSPRGVYEIAAGGGRVGWIAGDPNPELVLSPDFGATWVTRPLPAWAGRSLSIDRFGRLYLQDLENQLFRSRDDGATWEPFGLGLPRIAREVVADPFDAEKVFAMGLQLGAGFAGSGDVGIWSGRFTGENLVLGQGRFKARLTWKDAPGATGVGTPVAGTADTGFFWLFTPNRAEVAVKLLDGRAINGRFWVFVASLSNVEFDLEIEDLVEGTSHRYHNPQGVMASFADTQTFPLGGPEVAGVAYQPELPALLPPVASVELLERFEITVGWQDFGGQSGVGLGGQLNEESAGFYFFDAENLELLVNIIDGRSINGHYWVFFAGLSNVEYSITVRDRETGAVQIYHNPLGIFASSADTSAF